MYYVYIMGSRKHGTLYIGLTSNLLGRVYQHKAGVVAREKEIKKWRREWKINLIEQTNPEWIDLHETLAR